MALRSSYALAYDFRPATTTSSTRRRRPSATARSLKIPPGRFDNPYGHVGGDPHPIVTHRDAAYPSFGSFGAIDPDINSPRVHTWNVTLERRLGRLGRGGSYLGSYTDRLWGQVAVNPGVYMGLGRARFTACTYPVCSTNANLNQRRVLYLENPRRHCSSALVDLNDDVGSADVPRPEAVGPAPRGRRHQPERQLHVVQCKGTRRRQVHPTASGYTNPPDAEVRRGYCDQDRTHLASLTLGAATPQFGAPRCGMLASRVARVGNLDVPSGAWLNVTTGPRQRAHRHETSGRTR